MNTLIINHSGIIDQGGKKIKFKNRSGQNNRSWRKTPILPIIKYILPFLKYAMFSIKLLITLGFE